MSHLKKWNRSFSRTTCRTALYCLLCASLVVPSGPQAPPYLAVIAMSASAWRFMTTEAQHLLPFASVGFDQSFILKIKHRKCLWHLSYQFNPITFRNIFRAPTLGQVRFLKPVGRQTSNHSHHWCHLSRCPVSLWEEWFTCICSLDAQNSSKTGVYGERRNHPVNA